MISLIGASASETAYGLSHVIQGRLRHVQKRAIQARNRGKCVFYFQHPGRSALSNGLTVLDTDFIDEQRAHNPFASNLVPDL